MNSSLCIGWILCNENQQRDGLRSCSWRFVGKRVNVFKIGFVFILVKYERIKFLVIALKNAVEIYAWAPKPYHKFMAFKVCLSCTPCNCKYMISVLCRAEKHLAYVAELLRMPGRHGRWDPCWLKRLDKFCLRPTMKCYY